MKGVLQLDSTKFYCSKIDISKQYNTESNYFIRRYSNVSSYPTFNISCDSYFSFSTFNLSPFFYKSIHTPITTVLSTRDYVYSGTTLVKSMKFDVLPGRVIPISFTLTSIDLNKSQNSDQISQNLELDPYDVVTSKDMEVKIGSDVFHPKKLSISMENSIDIKRALGSESVYTNNIVKQLFDFEVSIDPIYIDTIQHQVFDIYIKYANVASIINNFNQPSSVHSYDVANTKTLKFESCVIDSISESVTYNSLPEVSVKFLPKKVLVI